MTNEEIIQQILSKCPLVTRQAVLERLRIEKNRSGGLIADATLLRLIAAEYGVGVSAGSICDRKLSISHLIPALNDVTVTGRVVGVCRARTFQGKKSGKYASLIIADNNDILRVMLWNDKADLVESDRLKTGQIVRFIHGYTRQDRDGIVELHVGEKSMVEVSPPDLEAKDYPSIGNFATKISDITAAQKKIHIMGIVHTVFPSSTFARQDLTVGKVLRFTLADSTGEVTVIVWNEKADELEPCLKPNVMVELVNSKVKAASTGGFEIHVDSSTYVGLSGLAGQMSKIADLREGARSVDVEGEVSVAPVIREVTTSRGETVRLAILELKDDSGAVWVSAWREHAGAVSELKVGKRVRLANVIVKRGLSGRVELSTKKSTVVTPL